MAISIAESLIVPPEDIHIPDLEQATFHPDENVESKAAEDASKSDWKSTASSTAKLLLRAIRDSADVLSPLKSVAGGLCFILENCEVRLSSGYNPQCLQCPRE